MRNVVVLNCYNVAISLIKRIKENLTMHNLCIERFEIKTDTLRKRIGWQGFPLHVRNYFRLLKESED